MSMLVSGGNGQLGSSLGRRRGVVALSSSQLDITNRDQVRDCLDSIRPSVVINAAAYTAVDRAESDRARAFAVNRDGVEVLAVECAGRGIRFIQISTDFVFGDVAGTPIHPDEEPVPMSVYGRSKHEGERICREVLGQEALIVRTSWVYAAGHRNFPATMLKLMREREQVSVVADQIGTPTWSETLADGILGLISADALGTHHLTDAGVASWYDFAFAIREIGLRRGLLDRPVVVSPIRTADYPTPAARPAFSVLDKTSTFGLLGRSLPHWWESLDRCLEDWQDPQ